MKLVLTDIGGTEHDLDTVILGLAADVFRLNQRLIRAEEELGITYQDAEAEATLDAEAGNVGSE